MINTIGRVVIVLNDFEKIDTILKKVLTLSACEEALFDLPHYFHHKNNFDLTILCSHRRNFLFSNSISFDMLGMLQNDILLLRSYHERV